MACFSSYYIITDEGICGNLLPLAIDNCSDNAICRVSSNGRELLDCYCRDGFLGNGFICRSKYYTKSMVEFSSLLI